MTRSASASSSAAMPSSRSARSRASCEQLQRPVRRGRRAVHLRVGDAPGRGRPPSSQASPRSTSGRSTVDLAARRTRGRPLAATAPGSRPARTARRRCRARRPAAGLSIRVLVERVLDDHRDRACRRRSGSAAAGVPPQPGTRPRKHLGQRERGGAGGQRAVVAVQRELEAAAHRRAVDERERRHRRRRAAGGRPRGRAGRSPAPASRLGDARHAGEVGADAKMNGLPVTRDAGDRACAPRASSSAASRLARPPGPNVVGLVWSWPLSSVISADLPAQPGQVDVADAARW